MGDLSAIGNGHFMHKNDTRHCTITPPNMVVHVAFCMVLNCRPLPVMTFGFLMAFHLIPFFFMVSHCIEGQVRNDGVHLGNGGHL